jgi:hypothetical protein
LRTSSLAGFFGPSPASSNVAISASWSVADPANLQVAAIGRLDHPTGKTLRSISNGKRPDPPI